MLSLLNNAGNRPRQVEKDDPRFVELRDMRIRGRAFDDAMELLEQQRARILQSKNAIRRKFNEKVEELPKWNQVDWVASLWTMESGDNL
jgi:hypothetical protein